MRAAAAQAIVQRPFPSPIRPGVIVSGFMPLKSEINPIALMRKLADAGAQLALPAVAGRGRPLVMRAFTFGDTLAPDILLVPLLCFDRSGHRIGYGAGYYDMTIAALRERKAVLAVGIGFAAQEIEQVPKTPRDARLDLMLTERESIDFRNT